jgi:PGF-pre-PGF domain-containing protein
MKKYFLIFFLVFALFFPLCSAMTLTNTNITATGINATINISNYIITFDRLDVFDNAITFYNLSYTNPSSCNGASSSYTTYNYTTSNSFSDLPAVSCTTTTTTGSGGGGSGGIINATTTKPAQITNYVNIIANQPEVINITNSNFDLTKIIITSNENITRASLIITEIKELPKSTENGLPLGVSYQIFGINITKINNTGIMNVIIEFKINKTWIAEQNATSKNITLYRMKNNETQWNLLNTTFLNEDDKYYYFNASTPGFSSFVIFLNKNEVKTNISKQIKSPFSFTIIVAVIIVLILIVVYILFSKIKRGVYQPYSKF